MSLSSLRDGAEPTAAEDETAADAHRRRPMTRWKLVLASDAPWSGEVYETRNGTRRRHFESLPELFHAITELTGWRLED